MNKVIKPFFDKTDNMKPYTVGDTYTNTVKRIASLIEQGYLDGEVPKKKSPKKSEK